MARYCAKCGRRLTKTAGPVGPVCGKECKLKKATNKVAKREMLQYIVKHDIFRSEQGK